MSVCKLPCLSVLLLAVAAGCSATSVSIGASNSGRVFDGIGAISGGGATSRLLGQLISTMQPVHVAVEAHATEAAFSGRSFLSSH
jgi:hypothetical protein